MLIFSVVDIPGSLRPILGRVVLAEHYLHLRERYTVRTVTDRVAGEWQILDFRLHFAEFPQLLDLEAAVLGEHNREIRQHNLSYAEEQVRELEFRGVLRCEDC